jgi:very-short-patch-repair endonuclease
MRIRYDPKLKQLSRELRNKSTLAEVLLWNQLKQRKMFGYQFARQKPIDHYIVDFNCPKLSLVVEIDGDSHRSKFREDFERQRRLESAGFNFLRFQDREVKMNMPNVLRAIENWIKQHGKTPPLTPFFKGEFETTP